MTDIIERLANNPGYIIEGYTWINVEWISEAKAEIERLRGTLRCQRCGASGDVIILCAGCQHPLEVRS